MRRNRRRGPLHDIEYLAHRIALPTIIDKNEWLVSASSTSGTAPGSQRCLDRYKTSDLLYFLGRWPRLMLSFDFNEFMCSSLCCRVCVALHPLVLMPPLAPPTPSPPSSKPKQHRRRKIERHQPRQTRSPVVTVSVLSHVHQLLAKYYLEQRSMSDALHHFSELVACTTDLVRPCGRGSCFF